MSDTFITARLVLLAGPVLKTEHDDGLPDMRGNRWILHEHFSEQVSDAMVRAWGAEEPLWMQQCHEDLTIRDDELAGAIESGILQHHSRIMRRHDVFIHETSVCYVNVYHTTLEFGGREEGGWWYNAHASIASVPCAFSEAEHLVRQLEQRYSFLDDELPLSSVLSKGKLSVWIEDSPGVDLPLQRPHYE